MVYGSHRTYKRQCLLLLALQEFDALLPGVGDETAATESFLRERGRLQQLRADVLRHTDL